ncbi:ATP-binding cassette domain-containing protein [Paenibacillus sp. P26]|nr:ATP-binding cassette domain-containing protein [Paenibacillus sp. P26]UUZ90994.1 ATP-binding cassette domain-containing protein [Paenibacillus sp. P25]
MTSPIVVAEQVTKHYGKKKALDSLDLVIPSGRVVGILGPNGRGKSTLFRAITGLVKPDEGRLEVLDGPPGWETNREIAYLPDRARWYPNDTALHAFEWGNRCSPASKWRLRGGSLRSWISTSI